MFTWPSSKESNKKQKLDDDAPQRVPTALLEPIELSASSGDDDVVDSTSRNKETERKSHSMSSSSGRAGNAVRAVEERKTGSVSNVLGDADTDPFALGPQKRKHGPSVIVDTSLDDLLPSDTEAALLLMKTKFPYRDGKQVVPVVLYSQLLSILKDRTKTDAELQVLVSQLKIIKLRLQSTGLEEFAYAFLSDYETHIRSTPVSNQNETALLGIHVFLFTSGVVCV